MDQRRVSKRLSYVLRHAPDSIGLTLSQDGWVETDALLAALAAHGLRLSRTELETLVAASDKQRFALDATGRRIRANQGHSVPVDLGYVPQRPPAVLFHGTATRTVPVILREGLRPGNRHAVHLSADEETAQRVGARRGQSTVLQIDAGALAADGAVFTRSANGVWLVDAVPPRYLSVV